MRSAERSESLWERSAPQAEFVPLREELRAEVAVVGAGIAGLTTAYLLARAGRRVVVLEKAGVGGGETGQTTAHLSSALDDRYQHLEELHGADGARLAYESHQAAIERVGEICRAEGIDCDYARLDGYLFLGGRDTPELLERELRAAHRAGFADVELLERAPGAPFHTGPCLRFPRQARFHPLKYLHGLARAVHRDGGHIFTGTNVTEVHGGSAPYLRTADGHTVHADALVVATNSPISERTAIHTKQAPYRTFVVAARVPEGAVPDALYWDTPDPYHYVRLQREGGETYLIVGGEDHKTGHRDDAAERYRCLEEWTRARFPIGPVELRWSGQVMEPVDGLAFIGPAPLDVTDLLSPSAAANVYLATGDSGHGMTHGTIAGILLSERILGREHPWASLYDAGRATPSALADFLRENLDVALKYTEWVRRTGDEVRDPAEIAPGSGALLRRRGLPIAAYRDDHGVLHERSAVCTHLGCIVHWNSAERSWDCPCHGSRYAPTGEVLNGPAPRPLSPVEEKR